MASKGSDIGLNVECKVRRQYHILKPLPAANISAKMRSITFLLTLLLVVLLSIGVQGADQGIKPTDLRKACLRKSDGKNAVAAVENFCKNTNIVRLFTSLCHWQAIILTGQLLGSPGSHRRQRQQRRSQGPICLRQDLGQVLASSVGAAEVLSLAVLLHVLAWEFTRFDGEGLRKKAMSALGD